MCVSPTFASPIEKAATSTHRRICREIIGNTEGNAKTVDSFWHCKWTNSVSNQPQNEKADRRSGRRRIFKMVDHFETFKKSSLHLKMTNFSNPSRWAISLSRKILRKILYKLYRASPLVIHCFPRIQIRLYVTSGRYQGVTLPS